MSKTDFLDNSYSFFKHWLKLKPSTNFPLAKKCRFLFRHNSLVFVEWQIVYFPIDIILRLCRKEKTSSFKVVKSFRAFYWNFHFILYNRRFKYKNGDFQIVFWKISSFIIKFNWSLLVLYILGYYGLHIYLAWSYALSNRMIRILRFFSIQTFFFHSKHFTF